MLALGQELAEVAANARGCSPDVTASATTAPAAKGPERSTSGAVEHHHSSLEKPSNSRLHRVLHFHSAICIALSSAPAPDSPSPRREPPTSSSPDHLLRWLLPLASRTRPTDNLWPCPSPTERALISEHPADADAQRTVRRLRGPRADHTSSAQTSF